MALSKTQIAKLYVSIFNRAAEGEALSTWGTQPDMATAAQLMLDTDAAKTYFGTSLDSNRDFIKHIYLNTLNKTETDDPDGIQNWVNQLDAGVMTRGEVVAAMIEAIDSYAPGGPKYDPTDAKTVAAYNQFANRVEVSEHMMDTIAHVDVNNLTPYTFKTPSNPNGGLTVTDDATTVTSANAVIDNLAPHTSLTTSTTDDIAGTANADLFVATVDSLTSGGTLQATDKINGGDGNDRIKIDAKQSFAGFTTGSMQDVETVDITKNFDGNFTFSTKGITGANKYIVDSTGHTGNISLTNLGNLADIELSGPKGTNSFTVAYNPASTVATGTQTDVQNLKVTDTGTQNTSTTAVSNAQYLNINIANVEELDLTTDGTANSVNLSGVTGAKTIKVSGEGITDIQAVDSAMTSFDASGSTGKVVANLTGTASNSVTSIKSGAGDDSIVADQTTLTANATIDLGAGDNDALTLVGGAKTAQFTMSGVESLNLGNSSSAITGALVFSGSHVTDLDTINVNNTGNNAITMANMAATDITVNTNGTMGSALSVDSGAKVVYNTNASTATATAGTGSDAVTGAATFGGATDITINVGKQTNVNTGAITANNATSATLNVDTLVAGGNEQTVFNTTLTVNKATSVTVDAKGQLGAAAALTAAKATSITVKAGQGTDTAANDALAINAGLAATAQALNTLDITAGHAFTLTGAFGKLQNLTVDTTAAFTGNGQNYTDMANLVVKGSALTSAATFGNLGTAGTTTHDVNVTATGLKAGLTLGTINTLASSKVDVSEVTGNVTLGNITADDGITVDAANLAGNLAGTAVLTTITGDIVVDVTNTAGATTLGNLATAGGTTGGDITVKAGNNIGGLTVGTLTGHNVSFDVSGALNGFTGSSGANTITITANKDVTVKADNLNGITANITADNNSSALTVDVTGQSQNDTISITGGTAQSSITAKGNLGTSTGDSLTVTLVDNTSNLNGSTAKQTVDLSGLTGSIPKANDTTFATTTILSADTDSAITYKGSAMDDQITYNFGASNANAISITDASNTDFDNLSIQGTATGLSLSSIETLTTTAAASINASAISGQTMNLSVAANTLTLTDTAANDTIDLQNMTITATAVGNMVVNASAGNDTIIGSATAETISGGAGNDTITAGGDNDALSGGAGQDTFNVDAGTDTIADLSGTTATTADILKVSSGATANANVTANWTATSATQNLGGAAANAVITDATGSLTIDLSSATVTTATTDGFTLVANAAGSTLIGSAGNDVFTGNAAASSTITGGAGDDTINLGAAGNADTIKIAFGGEGIDTVANFKDAEDIIDFTGTSDVANVSNLTTFDAATLVGNGNAAGNATVVANDGLMVVDNGNANTANAAGLTTAQVAAYLANIDADTDTVNVAYENTNSVFYIVVSDGTDSALFKADANGNSDNVIDANELTKIVTFTGLSDAGSLTTADFADFS